MGVPEGADLMTTPLSPPEKHFIRYRLESVIRADGTLTGRVEVTAEGQSDSSLRRTFTRYPLTMWPGEMQKEFFRLHPDIQVSDLVFPDPNDLSKPMRVVFRVTIPGYLKKGVGMAWLKPLSAFLPFQGVLSFLRMDTALTERKYPFRSRSSQQVEISEIMDIRGYGLPTQSPAFQQVSGSGADFSATFGRQGGRLNLGAKLVLKKRIYQPEDWDSVRRSILEFKKLMETPWFFSRGGEK
jgi:hypothetical protein